jgi:C4-type Zn-finger protein
MNEELKELVFTRTGVCKNCGYCTQTDKTGKRKPVPYILNIMMK